MLAAFTDSDRIDHPIPDESGKVFFESAAVLRSYKYLTENVLRGSPIGSMYKQGLQPYRIGHSFYDISACALP
jgi:hypothetical protein